MPYYLGYYVPIFLAISVLLNLLLSSTISQVGISALIHFSADQESLVYDLNFQAWKILTAKIIQLIIFLLIHWIH